MTSIEQLSAIKLEPLPSNLKYALLEFEENLHVIVLSKLESKHEQKVLRVLKKYKKEIGWTLANILGISLYMGIRRILLEDGENQLGNPKGGLTP